MDPDEARTVLGVPAGAPHVDVRQAFRRLVLDHHPDRTGGDGETTRRLVEAYRALTSDAPKPEPEPEHEPEPRAEADAAPLLESLLDGDAVEVELPPDEAFLVLLDAAADLGDVTYVDAEAGLLEVVRTRADGSRSSVVLTLQGRAAAGTTEVFVTEEPLG